MTVTSWYLATVWLGTKDAEDWATVDGRQIVRLMATDPEDFRRRVRESWPEKEITFGPVSLSKEQS